MVGIPSSRILRETRTFVTGIIAWDLENLAKGIFPAVDPFGHPWPSGSKRARRAGQAMPLKACFAAWKGDQEAHWQAHFLHRYYSRASVCDWCLAMSNDEVMSYSDFSPGAFWRRTQEHEAPMPNIHANDVSPWKQVQGYTKRRRLYDSSRAKDSMFPTRDDCLIYL